MILVPPHVSVFTSYFTLQARNDMVNVGERERNQNATVLKLAKIYGLLVCDHAYNGLWANLPWVVVAVSPSYSFGWRHAFSHGDYNLKTVVQASWVNRSRCLYKNTYTLSLVIAVNKTKNASSVINSIVITTKLVQNSKNLWRRDKTIMPYETVLVWPFCEVGG